MSTTTKKPGRAGVGYKQTDKRTAYQISLAHIDPPIFSSASADPTNADWKARYDVDVKLGDIYFDSNASYAPKVCTVVGTTPTWAGIGSAASMTIQSVFANGKIISGATSAGNALQIGDGTDNILLYRGGANSATITTASDTALTISTNGTGDITIAPAGGDTAITGTLDVSSTFTVASTKLSVNATTGTLTSTGYYLSSATAVANAFGVPADGSKFAVVASTGTITTAGNIISTATTGNALVINSNKFVVAADTGNVTCAGSIGGTFTGTFAGSWSGTAWNANPTITLSATTGVGLTIDGKTVTYGDIMRLLADVSLSGGNFIQCLGTATGSTACFTVAADGATTIKGTSAGSGALTVSAGDATLTSGHLVLTSGNATLSSGNLTLTAGKLTGAPSATSTNAVALTGTGARSAALVVITDTPNNGGPTFDINLTPGHANGFGFDIDVTGTSTAPIFDLAFAGAYACTGGVVNLNMTNAVGSVALNVTGAGTRTQPLVTLTDTGDSGGGAIYVSATSSNAASYALKVVENGTVANPLISLSYGAASTGDAIAIVMNSAAVTAQALTISSNVAHTNPTVSITTVGGAGGHALSIASTSGSATGHGLLITETGTQANNLISLAFGGACTGDAINVLMTNSAVTAQGFVFVSAVAHTNPNISLTSANGAAATFYMSNGSANASGHGISILQHGAAANDAVYIAYDAANTGDAIGIVMDGANIAAQAITLSSNVASTGDVVSLSSTGYVGAAGKALVAINESTATLAHAGASLCNITFTGTSAGSALGTNLRIISDGATAGSGVNYTAYLSANAANLEALLVDAGMCRFNEAVTLKASPVCYLAPNYVVAGGSSNAITAALHDSDGSHPAEAGGLELYITVGAYTLQAGANTFALNGGTAHAIKKSSAPTVDKAVAVAANGTVHLVLNAAADTWLDMSE